MHFEAPRRVDEHDVEGGAAARGRVSQSRASASITVTARAEPSRSHSPRRRSHTAPAVVDEHRVGGAPGDRFEAEHAASRQEVQAPCSREVGGEPVEEGLAHPVGGGAHVGFVFHGEPAPAPASRDDSHATTRHSSPTLPARLPCPPRSPRTRREHAARSRPPHRCSPGRNPRPPPSRTALRRTRENLSSGLADLFSPGTEDRCRPHRRGGRDPPRGRRRGGPRGPHSGRPPRPTQAAAARGRAGGAPSLARAHGAGARGGGPELRSPASCGAGAALRGAGGRRERGRKTTTIGKLAHRFREGGYSVVLAAGDTFRAAAIDQLQVWGKRNGRPGHRPAAGRRSGGGSLRRPCGRPPPGRRTSSSPTRRDGCTPGRGSWTSWPRCAGFSAESTPPPPTRPCWWLDAEPPARTGSPRRAGSRRRCG